MKINEIISILHQYISKYNSEYLFDTFASDLLFLEISNIEKSILQQRDTQTKSYSYTVLYGEGIRQMLHSYYTEVINRIGKTLPLLIQLDRTE